MLATAAWRRFAWLSRHRQQGSDEAVEVKLLATDAHDLRRMGTGAGTLPVSLAVALPHDLRRRP